MAKIQTYAGLSVEAERNFQMNLLLALKDAGIPLPFLMRACTETADRVRNLDCIPSIQPLADTLSRQYEDLAGIVSGSGMLPR